MEGIRNPNANTVYFIDGRIGMSKPFVESGFLFDMDRKTNKLTVIVYHDDYRTFDVSDIGKTIFSTKFEAIQLIQKLPEVGQTVYLLRKNGTVTEDVVKYFDVPNMYLESGESFLITEVGHSVFTSKDIHK